MSGKMFLSGPIGNPQTPTEKGRLYERAALAAMVQGQLLDLGWFCHNPYGAVHYGPNFRKDSALWLQSGFVYHYAFAMLIGVALLASWFMVGGAK